MEIQILCITKIALLGETAPNAVLYGGDRPMGETAPNAVLFRGYREAIERLLRGYREIIVKDIERQN